ncbi:tRNA (adenosine(37)-N6)-threonylcarbamoyltransferase complex ATPase subunit type 1 TsaE [Tumebacillus permanentifrigoris]|uniref:tRNA threonylcarbamoyladenosine biosynthesis protein TsaE n=1 Tax=Tumebacillus permanentifrigoris TaxID=378543 RepID=A0A316D3X1_9BACL|nr:tRNA (adenosine(37)-N6)-threonylcarbamoyltransferase complex ATPase subunit type 1 TsaE [Tumebacillus permanentifrigoris]PWK05996.1 tRNA threonylcarbamoyladenosine biosynthesis protein TsaE [Tumebacillus permanentifrigoris]
MLTYEMASVEATQALAARLGEVVQAGDVLCLSGDLGAGKTTFTQGLARGLGVEEPVSSPTFTIIKEYDDGRIPLYHMDIYRLGEAAVHEDLGYDEYFYGAGVSVIEWSEYLEDLLPEDRLLAHITIAEGGGRHLVFTATGPRATARLKELEQLCPTSH